MSSGEPVVRYNVRDLLAQIDARLRAIDEKLDLKASTAVVNALRADHEALAALVAVLQRKAEAKEAGVRGALATVGKVAAFAGWLIATALAVAVLILTVKHGGKP